MPCWISSIFPFGKNLCFIFSSIQSSKYWCNFVPSLDPENIQIWLAKTCWHPSAASWMNAISIIIVIIIGDANCKLPSIAYGGHIHSSAHLEIAKSGKAPFSPPHRTQCSCDAVGRSALYGPICFPSKMAIFPQLWPLMNIGQEMEKFWTNFSEFC